MPVLTPLSTPIIQQTQIENKADNINNKKSKLYFFSSNPITDAFVWGGLGAAAGAGIDIYNQKKLLKNESKVNYKIEDITKEIAEYTKNNLNIKKLEYSLECLKNKKINLNSVKNWAIGVGIVSFIPQLIGNVLFWTGKKGYDRIKQK